MSDKRDDVQTFWEAWEQFVEATGVRRFTCWLLDRITDGLAWLTRLIGRYT